MSIAIAIGATLFLGAFYSWTSRINGLFFFGRSADGLLRVSDQGRQIERQYRWAVVAMTALAVLLACAGARAGRNFAAVGPLFAAFAFLVIFARANRHVRALESVRGDAGPHESVVQVPLTEVPAYYVPGALVALLPAVLGGFAFLVALLLAGAGSGLQAGWAVWSTSIGERHLDTTLGLSLGLLSSATVLLLVFRASVRLRTNMAQYTIRASMILEWIGLALLLLVLGGNFLGFTLERRVSKAAIIVGLIAAFATLVWNQARARRFVPPPIEMGADDRWHWGLFYADRDDPALFVQSRCGAGYTLNYGRMLAWPISLAVVSYFIAMLFLPMHS